MLINVNVHPPTHREPVQASVWRKEHRMVMSRKQGYSIQM